MTITRLLRVIALQFSWAAVAVAQPGVGPVASDSAANKRAIAYEALKFSVPESPAFTFLGASPSKVARPSSMHDLGVEVLNGISADGKVQQGIAIEIAPWYYVRTRETLADYQRSGRAYLLRNLRVSLGTVKSEGDSASTDLGLGLRMTLSDETDPLANDSLSRELARAMLACTDRSPATTEALRAEQKRCLERSGDSLVTEQWNARRAAVAIATGMRLEESLLRRALGTGWAAWFGYSNHFGTRDQWIVSATYRDVRQVGADSAYGAATLGARFNYGSARANAFLEGVFESRFNTTVATKSSATAWTAGVEFRATDGVWVSTGFGNALKVDEAAPDRVVVLFGLRWGVSSAEKFGPR